VNYPEDFINKIICGDSRVVLKDIPDNVIDGVVTDPPYGFGRFEGDEKETFIELIREVFVDVKRVLKNGSWAFVFSGTGQTKELLNAIDLDFRRLLWMYKPQDESYPWRGWILSSECIALFSKGKPKPLVERRPYKHDCYVFTKVGQEGVEGHPTVKPLVIVGDLCRRIDGIILDPFAGSGTTALGCKRLKKDFIAIDIKPEYCKIIEERLLQEILL